MNKVLLISIQPQHVINILNLKNTFELPTWIPTDYRGWVYVYTTKKGVKPHHSNLGFNINQHYANEWAYSQGEEPKKCINGKVAFRFWFDGYEKVKTLYAKDIKQLEVFETPKKLRDFYRLKGTHYCEKVGNVYRHYDDVDETPITKAPKRFTYIYTDEVVL